MMASTPPPAPSLDAAVSRVRLLEEENARLRGDLRTIGRRLAHDLRTPLNSISVAGEALSDPARFGQSLPSLAQSIAEGVSETSALIDRLTPVLLATASDESPRPVHMDEIVGDALQRLESRILAAGATVTTAPVWPAAIGVAPWIELVWLNLLSNSLKHGGDHVRIELGAEVDGGEVRFSVHDSGNGIPLDKRSRLFHPLERLSELNAPRSYGLSLVHRLVSLQGGRCGYDPRPAPGGRFFFILPLAAQPAD